MHWTRALSMGLYVDRAKHPYGRMLLSHMMADSAEELEQARVYLSLPLSAKHHAGTPDEHLDVSEGRRVIAIRELGAEEVSSRRLVEIRRGKRQRSGTPDV